MALIRRVISTEYTDAEIEEIEHPLVNVTVDLPSEQVHTLGELFLPGEMTVTIVEPIITRSGYRYVPETASLTIRAGQTVCITGRLELAPREELQAQWLRPARIYMNTTPRNCNYLIVARTSGRSKIQSALRDRTPIYSERQFLESLADYYDELAMNGSTTLRAFALNALTTNGMAEYIRGA